jgi:hypothetical protein
MLRRTIFLVVLLITCSISSAAPDTQLIGVWKAVTYEINGVGHPMQGLFIFTKHYYSSNVRFKLSSEPIDDVNGNAGPYSRGPTEITFGQWVQVHIRPGDPEQPILARQGPDEVTEYAIQGQKLILTFPSKNRYILERLDDQSF